MQYFPLIPSDIHPVDAYKHKRKNLFSHNRAEANDIIARDKILNLMIAEIQVE